VECAEPREGSAAMATDFHAKATTFLTPDLACVEVWWADPIEGTDLLGRTGPCYVLVGSIGASMFGPIFPPNEATQRVLEVAAAARGAEGRKRDPFFDSRQRPWF
jgi:hypothetical protein